MSSDLAQIEQTAQVSAELANDYMIGGLSSTAGYAEGAELQDDVVRLMSSLGIDIAPVPVESGIVLAGALATVRASLATGAKKGAQALANNPSRWAIALGIAAGGVAASAGVYSWMTEDQQLELEKIRQSAALQAKLIQNLPPAQRTMLAQQYAKQTFSAGPPTLWPWLLVGGALAAWYVYKQRS
jgi:hypothetical protein